MTKPKLPSRFEFLLSYKSLITLYVDEAKIRQSNL